MKIGQLSDKQREKQLLVLLNEEKNLDKLEKQRQEKRIQEKNAKLDRRRARRAEYERRKSMVKSMNLGSASEGLGLNTE